MKEFKFKLIPILAGLISAIAFADPSIPIAITENPSTGEQSVLVINRSSQAELNGMSPKNFQSPEKLRALLERFKNYSKEAVTSSGKTILNIQGDFVLFSAALGAVTVQKLLTDYESNPDALKHFWYQQIINPFSWLSFYAFYVSNKGTSALYEALVSKIGWMRNEKLFAKYMNEISQSHFSKGYKALVTAGEIENANLIYQKAQAVIPKPMLHNFFSDLKGPLSLGIGIFFINLSMDFLNDENIQRCATEWNKDKYIDFCEIAYREWVIKGKILDQAPNFAGAVLTASVQSFLVNRGGSTAVNLLNRNTSKKLLGKLKSYEFKGLEIILNKTKNILSMRPVAFVSGAFIFLELFPHLTQPIEDYYQKNKIGSEIAKYQKNIEAQLSAGMIPESKSTSPSRIEKKFAINILLIDIEEYSKANIQWREHWILPVKKKLASWQSYISNLQGRYLSSKLFYHELVRLFAVPSIETNQLFQSTPYYGLDPSYSIEEIGKKIASAVQFSVEKIDSLKRQSTTLNEDQLQAMILLKSINSSLLSISPSSELPAALKLQIDKIQKDFTLNENTRAQKIIEARQEEFAKGIHRLQKMAKNPRVAPYGLSQMNEILKGAQPLDRGEFKLQQLNSDSNFIIERNESRYPMKVADLTVRSEAEYLLTQFVCSDDSVVSEIWGIGVYFHPPKMIQPQITHDRGLNFCKLRPENINSVSFETSVFNTHYKDADNSNLTGLLEVAQKYLRPEFKGPEALDNFENDWSKNVDSPIIKKLAAKNIEFNKMLTSTLNPILNDDSIDSVQTTAIQRGIYPSLKKEYEYYIKILGLIGKVYGLNINLQPAQKAFFLHEALLSKTLLPENLKQGLTVTELEKLNNKLTVIQATIKKEDKKILNRLNLLALSEVLDSREDDAFGTILESIKPTKSDPELISSFIFIKMKMAGVKLQWKNLLMLEESLDVKGLKIGSND